MEDGSFSSVALPEVSSIFPCLSFFFFGGGGYLIVMWVDLILLDLWWQIEWEQLVWGYGAESAALICCSVCFPGWSPAGVCWENSAPPAANHVQHPPTHSRAWNQPVTTRTDTVINTFYFPVTGNKPPSPARSQLSEEKPQTQKDHLKTSLHTTSLVLYRLQFDLV